MKRLQMVTILTLLLSVIEGRVFAYDAIVDGISYNLFDSTAHVTYCLFPSNNIYSGCVVIPETITYKGQSYTVDAIDGEAFHNCPGLTSVIIPNSVSSIGGGAFRNCTGLTSIIIPNSVKRINNNTFEGCTGLTDVTIPGSVNSIGLEAFEGCTSLMDIIIPESVLSIGSEAFKDCSSLASVNIPNSVTSIGYDAFKNTFIYTNSPDGVVFIDKWVCGYKGTMPSNTVITLQDGTMGIADNAFYGCSDLAGITIPNSVKSIGSGAFMGCANMENLTIGNSVVSIGNSAFSQCSSLTSLIIPKTVSSVGNYAFRGCQSLISICVGEYIESIGSSAFDGCTSLKEVKVLVTDYYAFCNNTVVGMIKTQIGKPVVLINEDERVIEDYMVPVGVTSIGNSAFQNCINLSTITLPYSVVSIGQYAFWGCSNLISATIPSSVTSISGPSSFHNCYNLTVKVPVTDFYTFSNNNIIDLIRYNIGVPVHLVDEKGNEILDFVIPEGVTHIGDYAFCNCSFLSNVNMPNSLTFIGYEAFSGCNGLVSVTIGKAIKQIEAKAFQNCSNLTDVYCYAREVPITKTTAFSYSSILDATLYVPKEAIDAYKASVPWKDFKDIVRIKLPEHTLKYLVDEEIYKIYQIEEEESIIPEQAPTKEGYTFSGWSEIPETMPAHDVTVTGTFSINSYTLTYMIDNVVYKTVEYEYGETITPEPKPDGDYQTFEWIGVPATMPAHDVTVHANYTSGIAEILMENSKVHIYDPNGLPYKELHKGLNIVRVRKEMTRKVVVK